MNRPIYVYGSPVLRQVAQPIDADYPGLKELIEEMFTAMRDSDGVGLAAPQLGLSIRLFVVDLSPFAKDEPEVANFRHPFINAQIIERFGPEKSFNEGCLSVPGIHEDVIRPESIRMQYQDAAFKQHEATFSGLAARVIQHEYDHLEGRLFVDSISPLRRRLLGNKLKAMARGRCSASYPGKIG